MGVAVVWSSAIDFLVVHVIWPVLRLLLPRCSPAVVVDAQAGRSVPAVVSDAAWVLLVCREDADDEDSMAKN